MENFQFYIVDAFTDTSFQGNHAGVILLDDINKDIDYLKKIVSETHLPEISFISKYHSGMMQNSFQDSDQYYYIRWVTSQTELDICGHGTIGAAYVVFNHLGINKENKFSKDNYLSEFNNSLFFIKSNGEKFSVTKKDSHFKIIFPTISIESCQCIPEIEACINTPISSLYRGRSYLAWLDDEKSVANLNPNFHKIKNLDLPGLIVASLSKDYDFVCRYFAPKKGIDEDAATGTANITIATLINKKTGQKEFHSKQLSSRGAEIFIKMIDENQVQLSGQARLFAQGSIYL